MNDRKFYDAARALTKEHRSLLIVDSIQAGLRAKGTLSVVNYPGFEGVAAPDMETCTSLRGHTASMGPTVCVSMCRGCLVFPRSADTPTSTVGT